MIDELDARGEGALEPLKITNPNKFIRQNICSLCFAELILEPQGSGVWYAKCPNHGLMMGHNHVNRFEANQIKEDIQDIKREIKKPSGKTTEEALKDLGF